MLKKKIFTKESTLANGVTLLRFLLIPAIVFFLFQREKTIALILLAFAFLTDVVDGFLARTLRQTSSFGKEFDRWTDKLLLFAVLLTLLYQFHSLLWWVVYLLLGIVFFFGAAVVTKKELEVTFINKIFMGLQSFVLFIMVLGYLNHWMLGLFTLLLLAPAGDYARKLLRKQSFFRR